LNAFEAEVSKSAKLLGLLYQKLAVPQSASIKLLSPPYDSFVLRRGIYTALELKSLKKHGSFPLSNIHDHQVEGLTRVIEEGGRAFLLINSRNVKQNGKLKSCNRAWALDFEKWGALIRELGNLQRVSIPTCLIEDPQWFLVLPRIRVEGQNEKLVPVWDLTTICKE
jgi:penicillin-binding protein-related factor A (putative recombinase)